MSALLLSIYHLNFDLLDLARVYCADITTLAPMAMMKMVMILLGLAWLVCLIGLSCVFSRHRLQMNFFILT